MMHSLSDFEKIGDYAQNIFGRVDEFRQADMSFSPAAMQELHAMCSAVGEALDLTVEGYVTPLGVGGQNRGTDRRSGRYPQGTSQEPPYRAIEP